jgi:hypothetical protein
VKVLAAGKSLKVAVLVWKELELVAKGKFGTIGNLLKFVGTSH